MKQTQCKRILRHMQDFGSITSKEAIEEYGCLRLASRIHDLKNQGYNISGKFVTSKNRYNEPVTYKKYYLE